MGCLYGIDRAAGKSADGKTATSNFLSGMMQSIPPLHDVAGMAGIDLPGYLGKLKSENAAPEDVSSAQQ